MLVPKTRSRLAPAAEKLTQKYIITNSAGSPAPLPGILISLVGDGAPGPVSLKFPQAILMHSQARETLISGSIVYLVLEPHLQYR